MLIYLNRIYKLSIKIPGGVFYIGDLHEKFTGLPLEKVIPVSINASILLKDSAATIWLPKKNSSSHPQIVNIIIHNDCFYGGIYPDEITHLIIKTNCI